MFTSLRVKLLVATCGLWLLVGAAPAQELKIGYVNSERVLREATPAKAAQSKLEAEFSKREKDLNDTAAKLKAAADKLAAAVALNQHCFNCGRSEMDAVLFPARNKGESTWVCVKCLPALIHG